MVEKHHEAAHRHEGMARYIGDQDADDLIEIIYDCSDALIIPHNTILGGDDG